MPAKLPDTVPAITKWIDHMEAKQKKKFNKMRQSMIMHARERLAMVNIQQCTKEPPPGKEPRAVNFAERIPNAREAAFAKAAQREGWSSIKRGWPDFLCWKGDELIAVEVKPDGHGLSMHQRVVIQKLQAAGMRCYIWSPLAGFRKLTDADFEVRGFQLTDHRDGRTMKNRVQRPKL